MPVLRDIVVQPGPSTSRAGRRVIAVIGIDRYQSWRGLANAVSDASGARSLFRQLGFEEVTPPLFDERATGHAIRTLVTDELSALGQDDSLVVFFAGHGGTRSQRVGDREVKTGYLIPADASDRFATWIGLEEWLYRVSLLPPRHILVILDACHSGIALSPTMRWRDAGPAQHVPLATLQARRSRVIITSALDSEIALDSGPVHGHSLFTGCLIQGLTGGLAGDLQQASGWVTTGTRMGMYLQDRVVSFPEHERRGGRQTPDVGRFDFDERGEMVIPLWLEEPRAPRPPPVTTLPAVIPTPPPASHASQAVPPRAPAATPPAFELASFSSHKAQVVDLLAAPVSNAPVPRRDGDVPRHGQPAASAGGKILGVPIVRLSDPGVQRKVLLLAGLALLALFAVPVSVNPLVFSLTVGGFQLVLWPLLASSAYLVIGAARKSVRFKLPVVVPWAPFGIACASIFITRGGFGFIESVTGSSGNGGAVGSGGLYLVGYTVLVFGHLARITRPEDRAARNLTAMGSLCLIPSWIDSIRFVGMFGELPPVVSMYVVLGFVFSTLGVSGFVFAMRPKAAPRLAGALVLWLPLQHVLAAIVGLSNGARIAPFLLLAHQMLPVLAHVGVLTMTSPAVYEEAKVMFARRGGRQM